MGLSGTGLKHYFVSVSLLLSHVTKRIQIAWANSFRGILLLLILDTIPSTILDIQLTNQIGGIRCVNLSNSNSKIA